MKHSGKMLVCLAGSLAVCAAAPGRTAADAGSPYQGIVERNVFGLKAPPPPPDPEANKPPPPKILLTGITTIFGSKLALMKMTPPPKAGEPPKEQAYTLKEGQREGDLEVLEIDEKAGTVKVNEYGIVTTLSFENNGVKTPAAGAPGPVPGAPPGLPSPMRTAMTYPGAGGAVGGSSPFTAARPVRLPGIGGSVTPQAAVGGGVGLPGGVNLGGNGLNLTGSGAAANPSATAQPAAPQLSQEENLIMLEANRLRHQQDNQSGRLPPLPRHPLTEGLMQSPGGSTAPAPTPQVQLPRPGAPLPLPQ